jgi:uncharacterized membrane protein
VSTQEETRHLSHLLALLLRGGVVLSALLFALGLVLVAFDDQPFDLAHFAHFSAPVRGGAMALLGSGTRSDLLLHLGLLTLLLLPVARLALAAVVFAKERDRLFSAISVVVLALIALSTALGRVE